MKSVLGDDMPYKTLVGFRRAKREESKVYLATKAYYSIQKRHISNLTNTQESDIINIQIDELTPCLRDNKTGELLDTQFSVVNAERLAPLKKQGWVFDWLRPIRDGETVVQLQLRGDDSIQGLIAYKDEPKNYAIFVSLVEAAPANKGRYGKFKGVGGHLFAIACKESINRGYNGYIFFKAKTNLIDYYKKELGAKQVNTTQILYVDEKNAMKLVERYFKDDIK